MPSMAGYVRPLGSARTYVRVAFLITTFLFIISSLTSSGTKRLIGPTHRYPVSPVVEGEVYMTLLCPPTPHPSLNGGIDWYFEATRILAYRLLHKPSTKDTGNRPLVVLTTEAVLPEQIRTLQAVGAIVRPVTAIEPPTGIDRSKINQQWKDQFTKLTVWNMTEYSKVLYIDSDILPVRPLSAVFETPLSEDIHGNEYLFAAVYDDGVVRDEGKFTRPVPKVGPDDTHGDTIFNAGMFLVHPSIEQARYINRIYQDPRMTQQFMDYMEQSLLRYAYRDDGPYPWTRLSLMYNTQWPRLEDLDGTHALHDKMWKENSPVDWDLRRFWYFAWGEMRGYQFSSSEAEMRSDVP